MTIKSLASEKSPLLDSSDCKKGQKNTLKIEYICGEANILLPALISFLTAECKDWFSWLSTRECLVPALLGNNWATQQELDAGDLRGRLEEQLSRCGKIC